jgi:hypothetical protein
MSICIEKKQTLSGDVYLFACELLLLKSDLGVLKYVIDREYDIQGIRLQPGDITYGLYWTNRPYTLYVWYLTGDRVVHYFNISDRTSLQPQEFLWRDLAIDILIADDHSVHILDEDELPGDLDPVLFSYIQKAKAAVIRDYSSIIDEANTIISSLPSHPVLSVRGTTNKPYSAG